MSRAAKLLLIALLGCGIGTFASLWRSPWWHRHSRKNCVTIMEGPTNEDGDFVAVHGRVVHIVRGDGASLAAKVEQVPDCAFALDAACRGAVCGFLCKDREGNVGLVVRRSGQYSTFSASKVTDRAGCTLAVAKLRALVSCSSDTIDLLSFDAQGGMVSMTRRAPEASALKGVFSSQNEARAGADDGEWGGGLYVEMGKGGELQVDKEWPWPWPVTSSRQESWLAGSLILSRPANHRASALLVHTGPRGWRVIAANQAFYQTVENMKALAPETTSPRTCDEGVLSLPEEDTLDAVITRERDILGVTADGLVYRSDSDGWRPLARLPTGQRPERLFYVSSLPVVVLESGELAVIDVAGKGSTPLEIDGLTMKAN